MYVYMYWKHCLKERLLQAPSPSTHQTRETRNIQECAQDWPRTPKRSRDDLSAKSISHSFDGLGMDLDIHLSLNVHDTSCHFSRVTATCPRIPQLNPLFSRSGTYISVIYQDNQI